MAIIDNRIVGDIDLADDLAVICGLGNTNAGLNYIVQNAHKLIDPYAKYKSVPCGVPFPDRDSEWWKGTNGQCGFIINEYTTEEALYAGKGNDWAYQPDPEYSRQKDFCDYWAAAPELHRGCNIPDRAGRGLSQTIRLQAGLTTPDHLYELTADDISIDGYTLNQLYFGVVTYRNGAPWGRFFASHPGLFQSVSCILSETQQWQQVGGKNTLVKVQAAVGSEIEVLPCLAKGNILGTIGTSLVVQKMYRLPGIGISTVTIAEPGTGGGGGGTTSDPFSIYLYAIWQLGKLVITTEVTGASSTPIYNCGVKVYKANTTTILWYENFDLPPQTSSTKEVRKLTESDVKGNTAVKVEFSILAGTYKKSVMAIMPNPDNDQPIITI